MEGPVSIKDEVEKVIFNLEDDVADEAPVLEENDFVLNTVSDELEENVEGAVNDEVEMDKTPTAELEEKQATNWNWSDVNDEEVQAGNFRKNNFRI